MTMVFGLMWAHGKFSLKIIIIVHNDEKDNQAEEWEKNKCQEWIQCDIWND